MLDEADIQADSLLINEDIGFVKLPNLTEEAFHLRNVGREKMGRIYFLILTSQGTFTIQNTAYVNFKTRQIRFLIAETVWRNSRLL